VWRGLPPPEAPGGDEETALLQAVLSGFPDRVARRRRPHEPHVLFAAGGAGILADSSVVSHAEYLVAVDAQQHGGGSVTVRAASAIEAEWLLERFPDRIREEDDVRFDDTCDAVIASHRLLYDGLVLDESKAPPAEAVAARMLAEVAWSRGIGSFCDPDALDRLRRRARFARTVDPSVPAVDDALVKATLADLAQGRSRLRELSDAGFLDLLRSRYGIAPLKSLDRLAPETTSVPGRRNVEVHYEDERPPWIESRLQDFFGLITGPTLGEPRVPLVLHLLAPNGRAVQVTTDLSGFWRTHYPGIRRELMRRYPRHSWPEDPITATPGGPRRRER
jgi:ATP-dependent helicase HrpB